MTRRCTHEASDCCCCCPSKPEPICCPLATGFIEPLYCEQRRIDLSNASPIELTNGFRIFFNNALSAFPQEPFCSNLTGDTDFDTPTVEVLFNPNIQAELLNRGICPMVVWAVNNGFPTLVRLSPGSSCPVTILPTPSVSCLAYVMCVDSTL